MRIWIIWPPSSGKTTLAATMSNAILDVEREIIHLYWGDVTKITDLVSFQKNIAIAQASREYELRESFTTDNPLYTSLAYCKIIWDAQLIKRATEFVRKHAKYDFLFYVPAEFPIVKDGVRHWDEAFQAIAENAILEVLEENKIQYYTITWTVEERKQQILYHTT